ncbi:hypothetical protein [Oligoflexus sp.]|uniref:hypothetical protein n=1 Tax=Oligoflexus sp. TaxID=1971216 RepID=UPI002D767E4A|nr:hypothetical protein [Oligoflexus sp.]
MRGSLAEDLSQQPYNDMAVHPFKRFYPRLPREILYFLTKSWSVGVALVLLLSNPHAHAADSPQGWRSVALMPWQLIGLDAEFTLRHRDQMQKMHRALQEAWIQNAQPLDQAAQQTRVALSLNEQRLAHSILVGATRASLTEPHHLQPIICPVGDSLLFAIELISTSRAQLVAAQQILVPRKPWEQWHKPGPAPAVPEGPWQEAMQNLLKDAGISRESARDNPFKLRLGLLRGSHDGRKASHLCLNMLTAHALAPSFTVLPLVGELETFHLRRVWDIQDPMLRATRELVLDWGMRPQGPEFKADARWSEAVLGSSIDSHLLVRTTIDISKEKLQLPNDLIQVLQKEAQSIKADDGPQVAKIYGAWAYLDRGRAWGLEMNDRLYLDDGQRLVKGHVVGFYGSGLGLTSPRGFPIHEGAILFIRTGQKKVRLGDTFGFDPTRYPTPWPPVRQPSQASTP